MLISLPATNSVSLSHTVSSTCTQAEHEFREPATPSCLPYLMQLAFGECTASSRWYTYATCCSDQLFTHVQTQLWTTEGGTVQTGNRKRGQQTLSASCSVFRATFNLRNKILAEYNQRTLSASCSVFWATLASRASLRKGPPMLRVSTCTHALIQAV